MTLLLEPSPAPDAPTVRAAVRRSARARRARRVVVGTGLLLGCLGVGVAALVLGDLPLSVADVLVALWGSGDAGAVFVVRELRLPRWLLGVLVGVAFGIAGGLFQSTLRNPLASPDVLGVSQGASVGAVLALLVLRADGTPVFVAALAGGALTGLVLYLVSWRGGLQGQRFILSGIALAYLCHSVLGYLLTRSDVREAQVALRWMTGSLAQATGELVVVLLVALGVLVPFAALAAPGLRTLLLGDDAARALGVRADATRVMVLALGVALAAIGTAAAGPVAFVALVAAPIARRLVGDGSLALVHCALAGALLVTLADLTAQHLLPGDAGVPVGVITGVIGGPYLIWLLLTAQRPRRST